MLNSTKLANSQSFANYHWVIEFESIVLTEISVHGTFSFDIEYQNLPIDLIVGLDVQAIEIYSQVPGLGFQIYTIKNNSSFFRLGKQLWDSGFFLTWHFGCCTCCNRKLWHELLSNVDLPHLLRSVLPLQEVLDLGCHILVPLHYLHKLNF